MTTTIQVADDVARHCRVTGVTIELVHVRTQTRDLDDELAYTAARIRDENVGRTAGEVPRVPAVRSMYRALGVDPHHTRPSSEALLRRVLRGEEMPRVNTVVDAANLWSVTRCCPVGLYDLRHAAGRILCRLGRQGEGYTGIRKDWVNVAGRPVLVDEEGPFGNPTSDSLRCAVTLSTTAVLAVAFQPPSFPAAEVQDLETLIRHYNHT